MWRAAWRAHLKDEVWGDRRRGRGHHGRHVHKMHPALLAVRQPRPAAAKHHVGGGAAEQHFPHRLRVSDALLGARAALCARTATQRSVTTGRKQHIGRAEFFRSVRLWGRRSPWCTGSCVATMTRSPCRSAADRTPCSHSSCACPTPTACFGDMPCEYAVPVEKSATPSSLNLMLIFHVA